MDTYFVHILSVNGEIKLDKNYDYVKVFNKQMLYQIGRETEYLEGRYVTQEIDISSKNIPYTIRYDVSCKHVTFLENKGKKYKFQVNNRVVSKLFDRVWKSLWDKNPSYDRASDEEIIFSVKTIDEYCSCLYKRHEAFIEEQNNEDFSFKGLTKRAIN